jgi:hypothetical protein
VEDNKQLLHIKMIKWLHTMIFGVHSCLKNGIGVQIPSSCIGELTQAMITKAKLLISIFL